MPTSELSDEMFQRVEEFAKVIRAVMDEDTDTATAFGIVLERGLKTALGDVVARREESTFVGSLHQLAASHPDVVYPYVADRVALGADIREFQARQGQIGFRKSRRRKC